MAKKIVILLDGTWNKKDDKDITNIAKLALELTSIPQPDQIVYYDEGVGTGTRTRIFETMEDPIDNIFERLHDRLAKGADRFIGGATGVGLSENIMQAYTFLAQNYDEGDRIYIFGFSRGAFTARSLTGMIRKAGILKSGKSTTPEQVQAAFNLYRRSDLMPSDLEARRFREENSYRVEDRNEQDEITGYHTRVHFLGVYDTVGSLGVPDDIYNDSDSDRVRFHDVTLSGMVETARHAVAIDEHREDFKPTLWDAQPSTNSEQRCFSGAHSDVGGSYHDHRASDIARCWMNTEASRAGLNIPDPRRNPVVLNDPRLAYAEEGDLGPIHDSRYYVINAAHFFRVRSQYVRALGTKSDETIDPSVPARAATNNKYRPRNSYIASHDFKVAIPDYLFNKVDSENDLVFAEPSKCTVM